MNGEAREVVAAHLLAWERRDHQYLAPDHPAFVRCREYAGVVLRALSDAGFTLIGPPDKSNCYECGLPVHAGSGECHGRAGFVHFNCIPDDTAALSDAGLLREDPEHG